MSYGIEVNNISGKTLITETITNHYVHTSGTQYPNFSANDLYEYPPPGVSTSSGDLILMRPNIDTSLESGTHTRGIMAVDHWGSTAELTWYNSLYHDSVDYIILKDFASANITPAGFGLSVFASNGAHTYSSGYKDSNVEVMAHAELRQFPDDTVGGLADLYTSKITFEFDDLDDIYVGMNTTHFWYAGNMTMIGYFYDFSNNTIDCVRGRLKSATTTPQDIRDVNGDVSTVSDLHAMYGIYKVTGL